MSAIVCGKRSSSIFEELNHTSPPSVSKRIRFSSGASSPPTTTARFSPPRPSPPSSVSLSSPPPSSSSFDHNNVSGKGNSYTTPLAHLTSLFPDMDQQLLQRALEASGNDLDSAIKSLNDLCLGSAERNLASAASKSDTGIGTDIQLSREGMIDSSGGASENPSATENLPKNGSEWVELFVREMMNASDMDDARARASIVLGVLEESIMTHASAEAVESFHKENLMLKEQIEVLLRENTILKRAVTIQHERQKEFDERSQELQHLKQVVSQYQEQLRTLEVNNYALTMHLRQAQQSNSIPGRFHPDIF